MLWVHHSFPRDLPDVRPRVIDVHDNIRALNHAMETLRTMDPAGREKTSPDWWRTWWATQRWDDRELEMLRSADAVVCISERDAHALRALLASAVPVFFLAFVPPPPLPPAVVVSTPSALVALCGVHRVALHGVHAFAQHVGPTLVRNGLHVDLYGSISTTCERMRMGNWLRAHGVHVRGTVDDPASEVFSSARAAIVMGLIPSGCKTQTATAMVHGVPAIGLASCAQSTPLEEEWAEGACTSWEEMGDAILAAHGTPRPTDRVHAAMHRFRERVDVDGVVARLCDATRIHL